MEPSGRNRWQPLADANEAGIAKQAKTVAVSYAQLPIGPHGKEGVSGSSPEEGFAKVPQVGTFSVGSACTISNVHHVWSRLWSFQVQPSAWRPRHCVGAAIT
jgi:hypothetical protein